ncbi:hypothetical protein [Clostridium estertheticum]|uniref:hypothetical protein n=1 Tax=Clostridium estertheticum TaxID=238834 RepID=UPI001C0E3547|nr:hypothetical protein [Clostridium estertheticum]MBU3072832.1 hypothetical protein [Clostridium estertheticum]MBU3163131.1 hypothetical protein [Clostridium estertheticum]
MNMNISDRARIRTLKIKITHAVIEGASVGSDFTIDEIKKQFYFKDSDLKNYLPKLFEKQNLNIVSETFKLKEIILKDIELYVENYNDVLNEKLTDLEFNLKTVYLKMKDYYENNNDDSEVLQRLIEEGTGIAIKLHWKYVPIYPEQYIINSNIIPEESLKEYYDHFHPLEDLYRYIFEESKISWKSTYGDINLNKEISMEIYTTRWGHYDNYRIKRTLDGWGISGLHSGNVKCAKDGEGALTDLLKHDSVCYPEEGLKYAMELLWNEADSTEMKMEELRRKISDIAEWINEVEKVTHQYQPEWCGYY